MEKHELLVVQRQKAGWVSWEPMRGMQAAIRRGTASFDTTGAKFMLTPAETVAATATPLEKGYVHVSMTATLAATKRRAIGWSGFFLAVGATAAGVMAAVGTGALALIPLAPMGLASYAALRGYRPVPGRVRIGLERALDFLERGGVKPAHETVPKTPGLFELLAGEVRRAIAASGERATQRAEEARRLRPRSGKQDRQ